jgi:hypothetical protein
MIITEINYSAVPLAVKSTSSSITALTFIIILRSDDDDIIARNKSRIKHDTIRQRTNTKIT